MRCIQEVRWRGHGARFLGVEKRQQQYQGKMLASFKSDDASLIMARGRLHMTPCYRWLETHRAQVQFIVTIISIFNLSLLICKCLNDLFIENEDISCVGQKMAPQWKELEFW